MVEPLNIFNGDFFVRKLFRVFLSGKSLLEKIFPTILRISCLSPLTFDHRSNR